MVMLGDNVLTFVSTICFQLLLVSIFTDGMACSRMFVLQKYASWITKEFFTQFFYLKFKNVVILFFQDSSIKICRNAY